MSAAVDVVGVFDSNLAQLFQTARPIKAMVKEESKLMEHPGETGVSITDHRIFQPVEIELSLILKPEGYRDTYAQIKAAYTQLTPLSVQTKTGTYANMYVLAMPHDEDPDFFDTVAIALKLREVILVAAQFSQLPAGQVAAGANGSKSNSSTVKTGQKTTTPATPQQESILHGIFFGGQ